MLTTRQQRIETIRKLLAVGREGSNATQNEIESAMSMAYRLMRQHDITEGEVGDHPPDLVTQKSVPCPWNVKRTRFIIGLLGAFFRVKVVYSESAMWRRCSMIFVGRESHIEVAHYVYEFLEGALQRAYRRERREHPRLATDPYYYGMIQGIGHNLDAERERAVPMGSELALANGEAEIDAYIAEHWPNAKSEKAPRPRSGASMNRGFDEGRRTHIRPAVKGQKGRGQNTLAKPVPRLTAPNPQLELFPSS